MPAPRARATTRHRQAEHTVVRAVSVTAAATPGQVTARRPFSNGAAPTRHPRNHSTVTPAASRSSSGPKRRAAGPIPAGAECRGATPVTRVSWANSSIGRPRPSGLAAGTVNRRDRAPVVPTRDDGSWRGSGGAVRAIKPADKPADEGAPPTIRIAGKGVLPPTWLAAVLGAAATAVLLGVVSVTAGLGLAAWIAGLATGAAAPGLLVAARGRSDQPALHPADWVTLTRLMLIAGVTGLVADSFSRTVSITALVTLSSVALALDAVDGQVARRTGTATPLGARIDGEADAFLILVLSIFVSQDYGSWVLAIGAARYALLLAGWLMPWLAAPLPPRYWGKVVAEYTGIVLTVAASGVTSRLTGMIAVVVALLLLAESFGRNVIWLYRTGAGPRTRRAVRITIAGFSVLLVWFDLVTPDRSWEFSLAAFARIPVEVLVLVAVALVLPPWPRRIVAVIAGLLLSALTLDKILNIEMWEELNRPFNPLNDWGSIRPAAGVVRDAIGTALTNVVLVAIWVGIAVLIVALTAATVHVTAVAARHRRGTVRGLVAVTAVWALAAGLSLQAAPGAPVASTSAT